MVKKILKKYKELEEKYKAVPLKADQRERLYKFLMEEAVDFCLITEGISKHR